MINNGKLNEGIGTKILMGVGKRLITYPLAFGRGVYQGAKEVGADLKKDREEFKARQTTPAKPTQATQTKPTPQVPVEKPKKSTKPKNKKVAPVPTDPI
jgi:hypothetical protein